jgi:preprotein translocase subunit SecA
MDEQRKRVYGFRQHLLEGGNCRDAILEMVTKQIDVHLSEFLKPNYGSGVFAAWAGTRLSALFEPRDFRGMDFDQAEQYAKSQAERAAETHVQDGIDENLAGEEGDEEAEAEWNWEALAKMAHTRWGLQLKDRDLKKVGRDNVAEYLLDSARAAVQKVDLSDGRPFLDPDYPLRTVVAWAHKQFGLDLALDEIQKLEPAALKEFVKERVIAAYRDREAEYPVMASLYRYTVGHGPQARLDREGLVAWARERFAAQLDLDDLKSKQRDEIRAVLLVHSRAAQEKADTALAEVQSRLERLFASPADGDQPARSLAGANGQLDSLSQWLDQTLHCKLTAEEIGDLTREQLEQRLTTAVEDRYRPEIRRMERSLLLQIVDTTWKDHLLVMDRLRSSVGLMGYAQVDPKVEYKREGMKLFEEMWRHIGDRATEYVFKIEQLNEDFVSSTWVETAATHEQAPGATEEFQRSQEQTSATNQGDTRPEPIRNRGQRVGRNEPCPCGSGKKYKNCHMRMGGGNIA